tara:strand:+ start:355 stop:705 length:351 start_codon:yes stop_codon:yes gene_type:complete
MTQCTNEIDFCPNSLVAGEDHHRIVIFREIRQVPGFYEIGRQIDDDPVVLQTGSNPIKVQGQRLLSDDRSVNKSIGGKVVLVVVLFQGTTNTTTISTENISKQLLSDVDFRKFDKY